MAKKEVQKSYSGAEVLKKMSDLDYQIKMPAKGNQNSNLLVGNLIKPKVDWAPGKSNWK